MVVFVLACFWNSTTETQSFEWVRFLITATTQLIQPSPDLAAGTPDEGHNDTPYLFNSN